MKAAAKGASDPSGQGDGEGGVVDSHDCDSELIVAELYVTHRKPLEVYLRRFVNEHDARDIVHDVFLKLFRSLPTWITSKDARRFLFVAVRNRALNHIRKSSRCAFLDPTALQQLADKRLQRDGGLCSDSDSDTDVMKLAPKLQRVYDLRQAGFSLQEIARRQGVCVATVKRRMLSIKRIGRLKNI